MLLLLVHVGATWAMVGLIWFVQVVHYPMFDALGRADFPVHGRRHQRLTTWVVGPTMLIEAVTAVALLWARPAGVGLWMPVAGLVMLGLIWLSTAAVQVPCHRALGGGFDAVVHARLVRTNWLRTALWSARGVGVLAMVAAASG